MIVAIALIVSLVIILGVVAFITSKINEGMDQDVMVGQSNLSEITKGQCGLSGKCKTKKLY